MKLGVVIDVKNIFMPDLLTDWQAQHQTTIFAHQDIHLPLSEGRINEWRLNLALKKFLAQNEIVFFEWAGPTLIKASRLNGSAKLVVRLHSFELYDFAPYIEWDGVDRIICVSQAMRDKFVALYPSQAGKIDVVYYGKPLDRFVPPTKSRLFNGNIGMLCTLLPIKRVYEMLLTLHELREAGHIFHLHLGGSPGKGADYERYYVSLMALIQKLDLTAQVTFHGQVKDVVSWLHGMDIFISNSYWEGQQNALLEAMTTGCYSLSHFWDGAEEVLPPDYLYATDSALKEKIIAYAALPEDAKQVRQAEMRSIACEKFDVEKIKIQMNHIFQAVLK